MALYDGTTKLSSQVLLTQYTEVSDLMKHYTIEVGDIGQTLFPINESEGKRRYLNGQAILQSQYPLFTTKLKAAVKLYPSLACTEAEWQTLRKNDIDDQVCKFVIDDTNGIIRLPRIKYLCGNLDLYRIGEGVPNRRLVRCKKATDSDRAWYNIYSDGYCEQGNTVTTSEVETRFTFSFPFINKPQLTLGRERGARNSVTTNTDYDGVWNFNNAGFNSWGNWNGFVMSWEARGYVDKSVIDSLQNIVSETIYDNCFESPYYIQVGTGVEYDLSGVVKYDLTTNNPYSFGDSKYCDIQLNNASWLASKGQWNSKAVYPDMYNWVLANANAKVNKFKLNTASYTDYDFVANTNAGTFRLPLLNGEEVYPSASSEILPLSADGTSFVAEKNGYYSVQNLNGKSFQFYVNGSIMSACANSNTQAVGVYVFVKAGSHVQYYYASDVNIGWYKFTPAVGNGQLYYYVGDTFQNPQGINLGGILERLTDLEAKIGGGQLVIETYTKDNSGYRLWSDGYCEQWGGFGDAYTDYRTQTINLSKVYKDTNYNVILTTGINGNAYVSMVSAKEKDSFTAMNTLNYLSLGSWKTEGYIS